jgi:hypothetical protein
MSMKNVLELLENPAYKEVQGWMNLKVPKVLHAWAEVYGEFRGNEGASPALEIGVHHGRFFLALEAAMPAGVQCFAVDVFGDQELNIDHSGKGNLTIFKENCARLAKDESRIKPIKLDSFSVPTCSGLPHQYSLISIDGGHTREHTGSDLLYANNSIKPGGLIILDDFSNVNWLGVMEGAMDFLAKPDRRIAPFFAGYNKRFLTTISEAGRLRYLMEKYIVEQFSDICLNRLSPLRGHVVRGLK